MEEVKTLATLVLGGAWDANELGDNDIMPAQDLIDDLQQRLVTGFDDVHIELVDRADLDRVTAERNALQLLLNNRDDLDDQLTSLEQRRYAEQQARKAAERDAERYRWLRKVTPYRFKKIQDAAVTDGGDVMYFHSDRFDAAVDAAIEAALNLASEAESQSPAPGYAPSPQQ